MSQGLGRCCRRASPKGEAARVGAATGARGRAAEAGGVRPAPSHIASNPHARRETPALTRRSVWWGREHPLPAPTPARGTGGAHQRRLGWSAGGSGPRERGKRATAGGAALSALIDQALRRSGNLGFRSATGLRLVGEVRVSPAWSACGMAEQWLAERPGCRGRRDVPVSICLRLNLFGSRALQPQGVVQE
jgi:hypothetical protein